MKNKKVIIAVSLTIILIILCIIPIITFADTKIEESLATSLETSENQIDAKLEAEKKQFETDVKNGKIKSEPSASTVLTAEEQKAEKEIKDKEDKTEKEAKEKEVKIKDIIGKFHKKDLEVAITKIQNEAANGIMNGSTVPEGQVELYNLILDTLQKEKLTQDEANILKEFMDEQYVNIQNNTQLKDKFDQIMKQ